MIAAHRRRHRLIFVLLAPAILLVLVAALFERRASVAVDALPAVLFTHAGKIGEGIVLWTREDLFAGFPARVVAYQGREIELKPLRPQAAPDLLLYWSPAMGSASVAAARLPEDVHLLGRIGGTGIHRFALPPLELGIEPGSLWLYSLGHQEVIARAPLLGLALGKGETR